MKKALIGFCLAVVLVMPQASQAQTSDMTALLAKLELLMKQVAELQAQLANVKEEIKAGLTEGMEDADIKKIQELLATDPTIYPKGIVSGYYGPLTSEAIKRFQERHEIKVTGTLDQETRDLMKEYMKERQNGKFPPGLLKAPGIAKKVKDRMYTEDGKKYLNCDDKKASGPLCKGVKYPVSTTTKTVSSVMATNAITAAEDAIDDLEDALDDATTTASTSAKDIADAKEDLADAKDKLADAKTEFSDKDYKSAQLRAIEAKKYAQSGLDELVGDDEDDNSIDDDGDEDEDESEDEDEDESEDD